MAATLLGEQLTEAHRLAQVQLGLQTVAMMRQFWVRLDLKNLDGTFEDWLASVQPIIEAQRKNSAVLAGTYYDTFKKVELAPEAVAIGPDYLALTLDMEALKAALVMTGPAYIKHAIVSGKTALEAYSNAEAMTAGVGSQFALDGGRETIMERSKTNIGYQRVCSGNPCAFCAMLASRGPVYNSRESGGFHPHAGCNCVPEPVVRHEGEWTEQAKFYKDQYNEATSLLRSGDILAEGKNPGLNAFRQHLGHQGLLTSY